MFTLRTLWLSTLLICVACQYDFNELYTPYDGGAQDGDGGVGDRSSHLIGLWGNHPNVDDECIQCAEVQCATVDEACRADPECVAFTRCVAETPTPAGLVTCRSSHLAWVTANDFLARDLTGPYGQCVFINKCVSECDGAADLSCFQDYTWPTTSDKTVPLHLTLNDSDDIGRLLAGVTAKVCLQGEPFCRTPAATGVTDERGYVKLDLPTGFAQAFTGFIELEGVGLYPQLLKFSWNIGGPTTHLATMISKNTFDLFSAVLGIPLDPTRGMYQTRMFGCAGYGLRDVQFSTTGADAQSSHWYLNSNGLPSTSATQTANIGAGGALNITTGYQTITAKRVSDGAEIARTDAPIRAGFLTILVFEPQGH